METTSQLISRFGLRAKKSFGQNFLLNPFICQRIVQSSKISSNSNVLEIGPGPGSLTREIISTCPKQFVAIEMDNDCIELLKFMINQHPEGKGNIEIRQGDAMKLNLPDLKLDKIKIISNLPYNIGTELLFKWLDQINYVESMTLMFQKEVADRITASPNCKDYGIVSVAVQSRCNVTKVMDLSPDCFYPAPKVHSAVVHITPKQEQISSEYYACLKKITSRLFQARRKKVRKNLIDIMGEELALKSGLDLDKRPDAISVKEYMDLAKLLLDRGK